MRQYEYELLEKKQETPDTFILRLSPKNEQFDFKPGQHALLSNPIQQGVFRPFSMASSPLNKKYLEFCIKTYGQWTGKLVNLPIGSRILVSEPKGKFIWDDDLTNAVFLTGGIGISPVMSILRYIHETGQKPNLTLLYGNRTPTAAAYRDELEELKGKIPLRVVDIYSDILENDPWNGHRGFITKDILQKEIDFSEKPVFFIVGPSIFIEKMEKALANLGVAKETIKKELF